MRPIILAANTTTFPGVGSNGLGRLSDCYKCLVTEEINDTYTLTAGCMVDSTHADLMVEGNYLYCPHDSTGDLQPFEIRRIKKKSDKSMEIYAEHVSYKLTRTAVTPYSRTSLDLALSSLPQKLRPAREFTFSATFTPGTDNGFETTIPMTARSMLNGQEGSIVDVYGQGEWEFDKWSCVLHQFRGSNNGARIRSGHNLVELSVQSEALNGYKAVYPYYYDPYNGHVVLATSIGSTGRVVSWNDDTDYDSAVALDLTADFQAEPTSQEVRDAAVSWLARNKPWVNEPTINIKYSALVDDSASGVVLGDTVLVTDRALGYSAQHRIVRTVWDVLNERYDSVTVGKLPPTLYDLIKKVK